MRTNSGKNGKTATCLLLDSDSVLMARGTHTMLDGGELLEVRVFDGSAEEVAKSRLILLVSIQKDGPTRLCQVKSRRGDVVTMEPVRTLDEQVRRNLRIPVDFYSYAYPAGGGQVPIMSNDLSCGGISFFTEREFKRGEQLEVVIPITAVSPLILKCQILRLCRQQGRLYLYAAKFVQMINDEETKIRESVFSVQLSCR